MHRSKSQQSQTQKLVIFSLLIQDCPILNNYVNFELPLLVLDSQDIWGKQSKLFSTEPIFSRFFSSVIVTIIIAFACNAKSSAIVIVFFFFPSLSFWSMFFDGTTEGFHMFHLLLLLECVTCTEHDMPCALGGDKQ